MDASSPNAPRPQPLEAVMRVSPYTPGEGSATATPVIKLSANENPHGPSPRAVEAYRRGAERLRLYPDGAATELRAAIGETQGLDPARVICGAGSDELIALLIQCFCAKGDQVLASAHAFSMYRIYALGLGAEPVVAPETDLRADVDALLAAVTAKTKILFLANPNNPTGTLLPAREVARLADQLPANVVLALDGAYAEYVRDQRDFDGGLALSAERENVVALRTFSKIHGLAALRIGWAHGPAAILDALHRARGPFNTSAPAQAAAAAAMRDRRYWEECALTNEVWRDWMVKELIRIGAPTPPSFGNFVIPEFGETGSRSASAVDAHLRSRGILARRIDGYGLPGRLRVTIGAPGDSMALMRELEAFMTAGEAGNG